ncbi:MAG TPA: glycosyltransferase [Solirubrobacteraceae bacterium]|nr:glycosyltransferase [Solirubrobacteraceae bacterium]
MALRISGSTSAPDSIVLAADLPARAQQLLAAGDLDGYRELFAQAERIEDVHRRYWANVQLLERGLAASSFATPAQLPGLFTAITAGALEVLEREPCEPKLLNYAGVALYELWSLDAATALFKAAKRLDPQLGQVDRNLQQVALRRRSLRGARRDPRLHPEVKGLARRALALATRAQPASGLRLSLCMIVRDEQEMLPRCLAAVADAVDEIVIVDTGSTDDTIEIARSFGAHVIEREWTGSFADARNVSFDAASGDWLMYLDADEVLVREDAQLLRSLTGRTWREAFYLAETNYTGDLEDGTAVTHNALRVFRNRKEYRFDGRLHEQIAKTLPGYLPERLESTNVRVEHYGYLGAVRDAREKSRRNIELLRMQMAETPATPFLHYNLGSEYAAAEDAHASLAEFERAWALMEADADRDLYEFAPALANRLVKALRVCGRLQDAITRADEALARFPGFTDLVFEQGAAALALGHTERAVSLWERCIELGDAPRRYTATIGCGTYLPRISIAEVKLAQGDVERACELLEHCAREHPEFYGVVLPYASALIAAGKTPDEVVIALAERIPELSATARFMLGTALYETGAAAAGEAQFRIVLERQPHSSRARVALGETLLAQKRYAEAAAVAAELPGEDPLAVIACRTELFARIVDGDGAGASAALERARNAGMTPAELDLFAAWRALAVDGRTEIALSVDAVPLLAVALEALLRVQDFEAFELLVGVLERTPLDQRSRRELLADMYMRRGFLASAAEEWMAVCQDQPDVSALLGLGRIAEARGMAAEASEFAAAALAHEPGNQAAADLLTQVRALAA